jgi:hypothetical protein
LVRVVVRKRHLPPKSPLRRNRAVAKLPPRKLRRLRKQRLLKPPPKVRARVVKAPAVRVPAAESPAACLRSAVKHCGVS